MFSDRTGCKVCQLVELLEGEGEKPCMRDQGTSGAHWPHMLRCRTCPSHLRAAVPPLFLENHSRLFLLASPLAKARDSYGAEHAPSVHRFHARHPCKARLLRCGGAPLTHPDRGLLPWEHLRPPRLGRHDLKPKPLL